MFDKPGVRTAIRAYLRLGGIYLVGLCLQSRTSRAPSLIRIASSWLASWVACLRLSMLALFPHFSSSHFSVDEPASTAARLEDDGRLVWPTAAERGREGLLGGVVVSTAWDPPRERFHICPSMIDDRGQSAAYAAHNTHTAYTRPITNKLLVLSHRVTCWNKYRCLVPELRTM